MPNLLILISFIVAAINIAAYFLMKIDKQRAIQNQWRLPEKLFFLLCACSGFIGIHLAMQQFRHKTQHLSFRFAVISAGIFWLVLLPFWLFFIMLNPKF